MNKEISYLRHGFADPHIVFHSEAEEVLSYVPLTSGGVVLNSSLPTRTFNEHNTSFHTHTLNPFRGSVQGEKTNNGTSR